MELTPHQAAAVHASLRRARFEIIPMKGVEDQLAHLPDDASITVTASPTKGLEATLELASTLATAGHQVIPHLSARLFTGRDHVADVMAQLDDLGVEEYFVPAGDAPEPAGPYEGAADLLPDIRKLGFAGRIGITGYPESHAFIDDATTISAMAAKAPQANHIVSQICYDPGTTASWVRVVRDRGIDLPIHVGLPGVVPFRRLLKISSRVGLGDSMRFLTKQHGVAKRLLTGYQPDHLVEGLADTAADETLGVAGWHLFTFNAVEDTVSWWRRQLAATAAAADTTTPRTTATADTVDATGSSSDQDATADLAHEPDSRPTTANHHRHDHRPGIA